MELIAGDIGGTKSWLAWTTGEADDVMRLRFEWVYASADFASAEALLRQFIADAQDAPRPDRLVLALPGPLHAQQVRLTNLDWTVDAGSLQTVLGIAEVKLINDFQAAAAGVAALSAADRVALNPQPVEPGGVRVITGAGTGLGLAFMLADAGAPVLQKPITLESVGLELERMLGVPVRPRSDAASADESSQSVRTA